MADRSDTVTPTAAGSGYIEINGCGRILTIRTALLAAVIPRNNDGSMVVLKSGDKVFLSCTPTDVSRAWQAADSGVRHDG